MDGIKLYPVTNEQSLINGCLKGDPKAQRLLYITYAPVMLGVCRRYVNDPDTAQDLLQEGFIKLFTHIGSYKGEGSLGGWMRRIFVTTSLEYLRQNDIARLSIPIEDCPGVEDDINPSVLSKLSADELYDCIAHLPAGYGTIFNLYVVEGYSHSEIADMLNIKESTSQSQLTRARKILQKMILSITGQKYAYGK